MSQVVAEDSSTEEIIDLKNPGVAALLAWLLPGLGHLYQGRTAKGVLFMTCILGTFFYGMFLSNGRAVYASWTPWDQRLPYLCQVGVGAPALPALLQTYLVRHNKAPLLGGIMAPPAQPADLNEMHRDLNRSLELGTVYTMIAGLLNLLVIFDAWGGPLFQSTSDDPDKPAEPTAASSG